MKLERNTLKDWLDIALKMTSIAAIFIGGFWAYYTFNVVDTTAKNIQISTGFETFPYDNKNRLLVVHVKIQNIGKVLAVPDKGGLVLSLKQIPTNLNVGMVDLSKVQQTYTKNISEKYKDGYELEPGVTYDEIESFVLPIGNTYYANAEIDLGPEEGIATSVNGEGIITIN